MVTGRSGRAAALPPEERRAAIIAAATPLLRRGGNDVTTRQIAQAAGVAEGTVFRAFPTKQALLDAVLADAGDLSGTVRKIRGIDLSAPLDERVRRCAAILTERLSTVIDLMIALRLRRPPPSPDGRDGESRLRAAHQQQHGRDQSEVLAAITAVLEPDAARLAYPPERAAHLLRLMTFAGTHRLINDGNPLTPDEVADVLLHGVARPAGAERPGEHPGDPPRRRREPRPGRGG
jgi:AcrR family transcriptional regulator